MTTTWTAYDREGIWRYDNPGFTYNQTTNPSTGQTIYYDSSGTPIAWTAQSKN